MNTINSSCKPFILGIGGTTRHGSSSEKALIACLRAAEGRGARTAIVAGPALDLPMYAPESSTRSESAQRLLKLFRECDGIIIASPSYHGSMPGLLKNALDYTEDLRADEGRTYFDGCAAGLISCGAGWQGAGQALATLRTIAHSLRAWPTPLGVMLNTSLPIFDPQGLCLDEVAARQLDTLAMQVIEFAQMRMRRDLEMATAL